MADRVLVVGGRGLVGRPLAERLRDAGRAVTIAGRRDPEVPGASWVATDLAAATEFPAGLGQVVHAAPLWLLPRHLGDLARGGTRRVVAFSSTSVVAKATSSDPAERRLAARLTDAERACHERCDAAGIALTIFRPTLVYGFGRDRNVARIAAVIRRFGVFPVAGAAAGGRQPVHALDLADAAVRALDAPVTHGVAYELSGADCLPYTALVERVFEALGRRPRVVHVPVPLYRLPLVAGRALRIGGGLHPGMAERMNRDQCFRHDAAVADFGFRPSPFLARPDRDLP